MGRKNRRPKQCVKPIEKIRKPPKPVLVPEPELRADPQEPKIIAFENISQGGGYRKTWIKLRKGAG